MAKDCEGSHICSQSPTCGDRVLDDFVVSESLAQAWAIVAACAIWDQEFGPHSPVRLMVKANTRTAMVRQLKVPIDFGVDLPFGPMPQTGCPSALCKPAAVLSPPCTNERLWEPCATSATLEGHTDANIGTAMVLDTNPEGVTTVRCNTNGRDHNQASVATCNGEYKGGLREPSTTVAPVGFDGDNYDNNDVRSLVQLGRDYNGLIGAIEEELRGVGGA